jgi:hypothetical protein
MPVTEGVARAAGGKMTGSNQLFIAFLAKTTPPWTIFEGLAPLGPAALASPE